MTDAPSTSSTQPASAHSPGAPGQSQPGAPSPHHSPRHSPHRSPYPDLRAPAPAQPLTGDPARRPPFPGTEHLNAAQVFGTPGYQAPPVSTPAPAVIALVLGLASVIPGVGVVSMAVGAWAVRRFRRTYGSAVSMAWFGLLAGAATSIGWLWLWWLYTLASA